jgi:hypothetical protein
MSRADDRKKGKVSRSEAAAGIEEESNLRLGDIISEEIKKALGRLKNDIDRANRELFESKFKHPQTSVKQQEKSKTKRSMNVDNTLWADLELLAFLSDSTVTDLLHIAANEYIKRKVGKKALTHLRQIKP